MNEDDVEINIKKLLEGAKPHVPKECCIYRVPLLIRQVNEEAYAPKVVSIGPYHHNRDHPTIQNMERHKVMYCKSFLERNNTSMESWIGYIKGKEREIRHCYSDTLEFSPNKLVEIMFVDSGFILELFSIYGSHNCSNDDTCLSTSWLSTTIRYDLLLLENQLPFFVLHDLFCLSSASASSGASFMKLTFQYFDSLNISKLTPVKNNEIKHFTDLIRAFHLKLPTVEEKEPPRNNDLVEHLPSATELSEAGVKFKQAKSNCLLDSEFTRSVLQIPQLVAQDFSEVLFRNMMALEQCHYPSKSYITDYVLVMDFLVNTSKDVDLLVRKGILVNYLGDSDSVAKMINGLCKYIAPSNFSSHYYDICKRLKDFSRNPLRKWKSTLRHDYCKGPWQTAATIAAIFLLVISFVQTVCSVWEVKALEP